MKKLLTILCFISHTTYFASAPKPLPRQHQPLRQEQDPISFRVTSINPAYLTCMKQCLQSSNGAACQDRCRDLMTRIVQHLAPKNENALISSGR